MNSTTNPVVAAVADASGEMLALEPHPTPSRETAEIAGIDHEGDGLGVAKDIRALIESAPEHIWLDLGENLEALSDDATFRDLSEVTWSEDNATGCGIKYVRATLPSPANTGEGESNSIAAGVSFAIEWLRNNYQDYPNIANLCDAMREAAPTAAPEQAGAVAQPSAAPGDGQGAADGTVWLIERGPNQGQLPHVWWIEGAEFLREWTTDASKATHYPTADAAHAAKAKHSNRLLRGDEAVTSHSFIDAAPQDGQASYSDCMPHLHIGDSAFEDWYQNYLPNSVGHKQIARDAYAAGMGDPLVIAAPGAAIAAREQEDIDPQPHHPGRWIDKQNPGWSFPSKEAAFAVRGQETINTARLAWLHTSNKDAEGYEYGVCKVQFDAAGKLESFLWTASDSSDVDAAMTAAGSVA